MVGEEITTMLVLHKSAICMETLPADKSLIAGNEISERIFPVYFALPHPLQINVSCIRTRLNYVLGKICLQGNSSPHPFPPAVAPLLK